MGTANFNITLAREQNPTMKFGVGLLPGVQPGSKASFIGGDLVVVPKGSKRVADAVNVKRAYYTDDNLDTVISDAKRQMKDIAAQG
jgi:multiple sugar transport system substrate-binding protein